MTLKENNYALCEDSECPNCLKVEEDGSYDEASDDNDEKRQGREAHKRLRKEYPRLEVCHPEPKHRKQYPRSCNRRFETGIISSPKMTALSSPIFCGWIAPKSSFFLIFASKTYSKKQSDIFDQK